MNSEVLVKLFGREHIVMRELEVSNESCRAVACVTRRAIHAVSPQTKHVRTKGRPEGT